MASLVIRLYWASQALFWLSAYRLCEAWEAQPASDTCFTGQSGLAMLAQSTMARYQHITGVWAIYLPCTSFYCKCMFHEIYD